MTDKDDGRKARSIRFPPELWKAIDADAKRCLRTSSTAHLEAVLVAYYELGNVELKDTSEARKTIEQKAQSLLSKGKESTAKAKPKRASKKAGSAN